MQTLINNLWIKLACLDWGINREIKEFVLLVNEVLNKNEMASKRQEPNAFHAFLAISFASVVKVIHSNRGEVNQAWIDGLV